MKRIRFVGWASEINHLRHLNVYVKVRTVFHYTFIHRSKHLIRKIIQSQTKKLRREAKK